MLKNVIIFQLKKNEPSNALRGPTSWKSTKFSNFIFFAQNIRLFLLFNMVWQPLPCDNGKYVWQGYKGEPIVARAASAVAALHSTSKLVSINHSIFFHIWCPLSAPEALTAQLRTDSWPYWCCAVQKTQTMLRSAGRQGQLFVIFQMLSWKVFFLFFFSNFESFHRSQFWR